MPPEDAAAPDEPPRLPFVAELGVWLLCTLATCAVAIGTARTAFPARPRALGGLAVVAAFTAALAAHAGWRTARARGSLSSFLFAAARVVVGVPVWLFALVASASGFAA